MSSLYLPAGYEPIDRSQIPSRSDPRDDTRRPERLVITPLGIDWVLVADPRDVRRYRAFDVSGNEHMHAAWPTMLRKLAEHQPQALGRRRW